MATFGTTPGGFVDRDVTLPNHYAWFVTLACLDVTFTSIILSAGGAELNAIAAWAADVAGLWGLILLKFTSVAAVIVVCEMLMHTNDEQQDRTQRIGRRLAEWAVAVSSIPVAVGGIQLVAGLALGHVTLL